MADVAYGSLPFAEQIAFFRRKLNLPTNAWTDIWQEAHDHAFVVAGVNRMDMLQDFREAVDAAIANGETLQQFRKRFDAIVAKYGWDYNGGRNWRSRVIYETNLRSSYAAGRWAQLQQIKQRVPYWEYVHADGELHPRPMHLAWNGLILSADDPWWHTHFPPGGWGCECTVRGRSMLDLAGMDKAGPDQAPPIDMLQVTVGQRSPGGPRVVETPAGIDPGFGYAPGRDAWLREQAERVAQAADAQASAQWQPLINATAEDVGRPSIVPAVPAPVQLDAPTTSAIEVENAARELLGGDARVFDVRGLPVDVTAETLGSVTSPADGAYLPLLIDTLADPYEVWVQLDRATTGQSRVRTTILKRYVFPDGSAVWILAHQQDGALVDWRVLGAAETTDAMHQRSGMLWWGQP